MPLMDLRCRGSWRGPSLCGNDVQCNTRQLARKRSKSCKSTVTCDLHHRQSICIAFEPNTSSSGFRERSLVAGCIITLAVIFLFPFMVLASALLPRSADGSLGATVRTSQGPIIGHSASNRSHVNEFLGIPYAQPSIGSLRFDAPQKYTKYETFDALNFVSPVDLHSVAQLHADFVGFLVTVCTSPALV